MKNIKQAIFLSTAGIFVCLNFWVVFAIFSSPVKSSKLLAFFVGLSLLSLVSFIWLAISPSLQEKIFVIVDKIFSNIRIPILVVSFLLSISWIYLSLTAKQLSNMDLILRPAALWTVNLSIVFIISLSVWGISQLKISETNKRTLKTSVIIFLLILIIYIFIAVTRLGLNPTGYYWYAPGTPLLISQLVIALVPALVFFYLEKKITENKNKIKPRLDLLVGFALWLLTAILWLTEPISQPINFLPAPYPPNFELYPDSDSALLDINAQGLLAGNNLSANPADKPAYSFFIYLLHLVAGQDYELLSNLQVVFLSTIPVILYFLLGGVFSNRSVGIAAAILLILREKSSIALTNIILVSHSKLILSDVPSLGLMLLFSTILMGWIQKPGQRRLWPLAFGIVLGIFLLLRTQIIVLIPFAILGAAIPIYRRAPKMLFQASILAFVGVISCTLPWAVYAATGPANANSTAYFRQLAIQFQFDPLNHIVRPMDGESQDEFNTRMQKQVTEFVKENPVYVVKSISAYFSRNLIQSISYLPLSFQLETSPKEYVKRLPFWDSWTGQLPEESKVIFFLNLALIAIGIGKAWEKTQFTGLIPLLFFLGYISSLALPMISGWRFIMTVDWVPLLYYLLGIWEVGTWLFAGFFKKVHLTHEYPPEIHQIIPFPMMNFSAIVLIAVLLNSSPFMIRWLDSARVIPAKNEDMVQLYAQKRSSLTGEFPSPQQVQEFLKEQNAIALYGRALYPRFFEKNQGLSNNGLVSFRSHDFNRLGFYLIGTTNESILLPIENSPESFPHTTDVLIFGCKRETLRFNRSYTEALMVIQVNKNMATLKSNWKELTCSPKP